MFYSSLQTTVCYKTVKQLTRLRGKHGRINCKVDGGTLRISRINVATKAVLGLMDVSHRMFCIRRNSRTATHA